MKNKILSLVLLFSAFISLQSWSQATFDTVTIHFDIDKYDLKQDAINILDKVTADLKKSGDKILIFGYADYLGAALPNDTLSELRAAKTADFLINNGISRQQIIQISGVGQQLEKGKEAHGNIKNRRVDIYIRRNTIANTFPENTSKNIVENTIKPQDKIDFSTMKVDQTLVLKDILFYESRSVIIPTSMQTLEDLYQALEDNPNVKIKLEGHICCIRNHYDGYDLAQNNYGLSTNRARLIYDFLIKKGIDKNRLDFIGFGNTKPLIFPEKNENDAQRNRRVEVRITDI